MAPNAKLNLATYAGTCNPSLGTMLRPSSTRSSRTARGGSTDAGLVVCTLAAPRVVGNHTLPSGARKPDGCLPPESCAPSPPNGMLEDLALIGRAPDGYGPESSVSSAEAIRFGLVNQYVPRLS